LHCHRQQAKNYQNNHCPNRNFNKIVHIHINLIFTHNIMKNILNIQIGIKFDAIFALTLFLENYEK